VPYQTALEWVSGSWFLAAAIIPFEKARNLIGKDLSREEKCVRGNLVYGLSQVDRDLLDVFEGDVSHLPEWPPGSEH
jgi:hypothetical protein